MGRNFPHRKLTLVCDITTTGRMVLVLIKSKRCFVNLAIYLVGEAAVTLFVLYFVVIYFFLSYVK